MCDHYLVEGRIRVNGNFVRQERRNIQEKVKVEQLERNEVMWRHEENLKERLENRRDVEWDNEINGAYIYCISRGYLTFPQNQPKIFKDLKTPYCMLYKMKKEFFKLLQK